MFLNLTYKNGNKVKIEIHFFFITVSYYNWREVGEDISKDCNSVKIDEISEIVITDW